MYWLSAVCLFSALLNVYGESCEEPSVTSSTYTSTSLILSTQTAYVAEFAVTCKSGSGNMNLYAAVGGEIVPAAKVPEVDSYQVSWASEHKAAKTGDHTIKVYSEEGYGAYRKAQRNGEDVSAIPALFSVNLNHPGTQREGLFVQTEFVAVVAALLVWWMANSMRSQIME